MVCDQSSSVGLCLQDYRSLCAAVILAVVVNTQTDNFWLIILLAQPAERKCLQLFFEKVIRRASLKFNSVGSRFDGQGSSWKTLCRRSFVLLFTTSQKGYRAAKSSAVDDSASLKKFSEAAELHNRLVSTTDSAAQSWADQMSATDVARRLPVTSGRLQSKAQHAFCLVRRQLGVSKRRRSTSNVYDTHLFIQYFSLLAVAWNFVLRDALPSAVCVTALWLVLSCAYLRRDGLAELTWVADFYRIS